MQDITVNLSWLFLGGYIVWLYTYLSEIEPFCFYLPGGLGKYYKIHKNIETKFSDVVGCDEIKEELKCHLEFFNKTKLTKGWLFNGPPGTGKTLMAKAVAGETNLPFIEVFTNNLTNSHIPTVLNKVIKKHSPCIIFIDECSNIFGQFSDTLLRQIDGIDCIKDVFLIIATDKKLDDSFVRSGRIDKVINFVKPLHNDRKKMFLHIGYEEKEAYKLAQQTSGLTYADISIIPREINFQKLLGKDQNTNKIIDNIRFGRNTSNIKINDDQRDRIAYHEIGHLMVSCLIKGCDKPYKITIISDGRFVGRVEIIKDDDVYKTKTDIIKNIAVLLGSSVFEKHYFKEYSTLCCHDFEVIDKLIDIMKDNYMLGYKSTGKKYLTQVQFDEVDRIVNKLQSIISNIIDTHKDIIEILYRELITNETLMIDNINNIIKADIYDTIILEDLLNE